jgi:hypothetical protein
MTFLFTTRLKIIVFISVVIIFGAVILLGYELGWRSAISDYEEKQKKINAQPVSAAEKKIPDSESKN